MTQGNATHIKTTQHTKRQGNVTIQDKTKQDKTT